MLRIIAAIRARLLHDARGVDAVQNPNVQQGTNGTTNKVLDVATMPRIMSRITDGLKRPFFMCMDPWPAIVQQFFIQEHAKTGLRGIVLLAYNAAFSF